MGLPLQTDNWSFMNPDMYKSNYVSPLKNLLSSSSAVLAVIRYVWRWTQTIQQRLGGYALVTPPPDRPSALTAVAKLGMIMAYFYLCDRTNFFMKENKYYSEWSFWLPVGYVIALGLFFTDDSKSNR